MMTIPSYSNETKLDSLIENYIFDMTVEWDQRDEVYAQEKLTLFQNELKVLIESGLNPKDIEKELHLVRPAGVSWNGKIKWHPANYLFTLLTISLGIALSYNDNSDPVCSVGGNWFEIKCEGSGNCYHFLHESCE
jgi:hypothetical protein